MDDVNAMLKALALHTSHAVRTLGVLLFLSASVMAQEPHKSLFTIERHIFTIHVRADGSYEEKIETVTLAKSTAAIEAVSQDELDFYSDRENVKVLEAFTELPSGERLPVGAEAIRVVDEERSDGAAMCSIFLTTLVSRYLQIVEVLEADA